AELARRRLAQDVTDRLRNWWPIGAYQQTIPIPQLLYDIDAHVLRFLAIAQDLQQKGNNAWIADALEIHQHVALGRRRGEQRLPIDADGTLQLVHPSPSRRSRHSDADLGTDTDDAVHLERGSDGRRAFAHRLQAEMSRPRRARVETAAVVGDQQ